MAFNRLPPGAPLPQVKAKSQTFPIHPALRELRPKAPGAQQSLDSTSDECIRYRERLNKLQNSEEWDRWRTIQKLPDGSKQRVHWEQEKQQLMIHIGQLQARIQPLHQTIRQKEAQNIELMVRVTAVEEERRKWQNAYQDLRSEIDLRLDMANAKDKQIRVLRKRLHQHPVALSHHTSDLCPIPEDDYAEFRRGPYDDDEGGADITVSLSALRKDLSQIPSPEQRSQSSRSLH